MEKPLIYLILAIPVAVLLTVTTSLSVPESVLSTLFTVAGVIFSVGMSITITPKTEKVTMRKPRNNIRKSYLKVRNSFICLFGFDTVLFIIAELLPKSSNVSTCIGIACAILLVESIIYFICNFIKLQKLGEDIENQILKEVSNAEKSAKEAGTKEMP